MRWAPPQRRYSGSRISIIGVEALGAEKPSCLLGAKAYARAPPVIPLTLSPAPPCPRSPRMCARPARPPLSPHPGRDAGRDGQVHGAYRCASQPPATVRRAGILSGVNLLQSSINQSINQCSVSHQLSQHP